MAPLLAALRDSIARPAALFRRCAEGRGSPSAAENRKALLGAAPFAPFLCLALLGSTAGGAPEADALELGLLGLYAAATWPAATLAFWAVARILGYRPDFGLLLGAWGASYWATDLFAAALAATHVLAPALGYSPAGIPAWASSLALVAYLCAAIWKLLYALAVIRYAIGARGFRSAAALAMLLVLAGLFALLSAFLFGLKVPIL